MWCQVVNWRKDLQPFKKLSDGKAIANLIDDDPTNWLDRLSFWPN